MRYHEPPPFWGPKSKPKRKNEQDDCSSKEKVNFNQISIKITSYLNYFYLKINKTSNDTDEQITE